MLEIEQKYNEIRKPVYDKRNDIIKAISEFWLTAVSLSFYTYYEIVVCYDIGNALFTIVAVLVQFLSHPALGDLLNEEDQKVWTLFSTY